MRTPHLLWSDLVGGWALRGAMLTGGSRTPGGATVCRMEGRRIRYHRVVNRVLAPLKEGAGQTLRIAALAAAVLAAPVAAGCGGCPGTTDLTEEALPDRPAVLDEIDLLFEREKFSEAARWARELRPEFEREYGPDSLQSAWLLDLLVEALRRDVHGRKDETLDLAQQAVEIKEERLGPDHLEVTRSLINLAEVHAQRAEDDDAERIFTDVVARRERALSPGDREIWAARIYLAAFHYERQRYEEARVGYERALADLPPAEDPGASERLSDRLLTLRNIGLALGKLEEYTNALEILEDVLDLRRRLGQALKVAETLNSLALLQDDLGLYTDAERHFLEALDIRKHHLEPDHPYIADVRGNLGATYRAMGRYDEALENFDLAEDAYKRRKSEADVARVKHNKARTCSLMGDYATAEPLFQQALETRLRILPEDHTGIAATRRYFASMLLELKECSRATNQMREALRIARKKLVSSPLELSWYLRTQARVEEICGSPDVAETLLDEALDAQRSAFGDDHPWTAETRRLLARHHARSGHFSRALRIQSRAVEGLSRSLSEEHPLLLQALVEKAELQACTGQQEKALVQVLQTEGRARDHVRSAIRVLPARQALRYAGTLGSGMDLALAITAETPESKRTVREAWNAIVGWRSLVLEEMAVRWAHAHQSENEEVRRLRRTLEEATRRLAEVLVRGPASRSAEDYRELIDRFIREKERLERELARASDQFRAERARREPSMDDVDRALPNGTALVAFAKYARVACSEDRASRSQPSPGESAPRAEPVRGTTVWAEPHYAALVRPPGGGALIMRALGPASSVEGRVRAWSRAASQPPPENPQAAHEAEQKLSAFGDELRRWIWDPVAPYIEGADEVVIVPDGDLHLVNFGALPRPGGGYLVEAGPLRRYVSAERDLVATRRPVRTGTRLLAMGGPDFEGALPAKGGGTSTTTTLRVPGETSKCPRFEDLWFPALLEASGEAEEVAELWRKAEPFPMATFARAGRDQEHEGQVVLLTGKEATEAAFKRWAPGSRLLHLATHGFFLEGECPSVLETTLQRESVRAIGLVSPAAGRSAGSGLLGENPLLLAGLALAGANRRGEAGKGLEDGILTAEEVAALDLRSVELAVLSACDTARGRIETGEGVYGFRRAFEIAGADSVVVSLWKVEDRATREWMTAFYRSHLGDGRRLPEAIRLTSLTVLRQKRQEGKTGHPFWWAPFVAVGGSR